MIRFLYLSGRKSGFLICESPEALQERRGSECIIAANPPGGVIASFYDSRAVDRLRLRPFLLCFVPSNALVGCRVGKVLVDIPTRQKRPPQRGVLEERKSQPSFGAGAAAGPRRGWRG